MLWRAFWQEHVVTACLHLHRLKAEAKRNRKLPVTYFLKLDPFLKLHILPNTRSSQRLSVQMYKAEGTFHIQILSTCRKKGTLCPDDFISKAIILAQVSRSLSDSDDVTYPLISSLPQLQPRTQHSYRLSVLHICSFLFLCIMISMWLGS